MSSGSFGSILEVAGLSAPFLAHFQLTEAIRNGGSSLLSHKPQRGKRKQRRRREERGLPSDEDLLILATIYLENQRQLWPEKAASGELPTIADQSIGEMVGSFKKRFLGEQPVELPEHLVAELLALAYLRYSDEGSNARSNSQQLINILIRARRDGLFIPWTLVFADAAVTGTVAKRRGYEMAKEAVADPALAIASFYVDDIGRGARDIIETMSLGQTIWALHKRLIGVTDGFDSEGPLAKLILAIFAFFQEWFIEQLQDKVNRGMQDAFRRGANTGLPAPGFKLVDFFDQDGRPVMGREGEQTKTLQIDESAAKVIRHIFKMYVDKLSSPESIAKFLNRIRFTGATSWDGSRVRQILRRRLYIGIQIYRMTYQVRDKVSGGVKVIKRPRKEWLIRRNRLLQIIPYSLWKRTQRRLKTVKEAWAKSQENAPKKLSRGEVYAKTLFRPNCDDCKAPMIIGGNASYRTFVCPNGQHGKHGCKSNSYKSVPKFERAMLAALQNDLLDEKRIPDLVRQVERYLKEFAETPKLDTAPIRRDIKNAKARIARLVQLVTKDDGKELVVAEVRQEIEHQQKQLIQFGKQLHDAEAQNAPAPKAPTETEVQAYFADLRGLLYGDVARSAEVLRKLTGPIFVKQQKSALSRGSLWTAHFNANLTAAFAVIEAGKDSRLKGIWEFLNTRQSMNPIPMAIVIRDRIPKYEERSPRIQELLAKGATRIAIAAALGIAQSDVRHTEKFIKTGERPKWLRKKKRSRATRKEPYVPPYLRAKNEVKRLKDVEEMTWRQIRQRIGETMDIWVKTACLRRAYDAADTAKCQEAVDAGKKMVRGRWSLLGPDVYRRMDEMIRAGRTFVEIARDLGCSNSTVRLRKKKLGP